MRGKGLRGGRVQQGIQHIIIRKKLTGAEDIYPDTKLRHIPDEEPFYSPDPYRIPSKEIHPDAKLFPGERDKFLFLSLLQKLSLRFRSRILAFVLMDTHAHLLVRSDTISIFIGTLCSRYTACYNKKYASKGTLFQRTFINFIKDYELWQIDTLFYILNNPLEAGICKRHKDYFFSSYKLNTNESTALNNIISTDNSLIIKHFKNTAQFKAALRQKLNYQKSTAHIKYPNRHK